METFEITYEDALYPDGKIRPFVDFINCPFATAAKRVFGDRVKTVNIYAIRFTDTTDVKWIAHGFGKVQYRNLISTKQPFKTHFYNP